MDLRDAATGQMKSLQLRTTLRKFNSRLSISRISELLKNQTPYLLTRQLYRRQTLLKVRRHRQSLLLKQKCSHHLKKERKISTISFRLKITPNSSKTIINSKEVATEAAVEALADTEVDL